MIRILDKINESRGNLEIGIFTSENVEIRITSEIVKILQEVLIGQYFRKSYIPAKPDLVFKVGFTS